LIEDLEELFESDSILKFLKRKVLIISDIIGLSLLLDTATITFVLTYLNQVFDLLKEKHDWFACFISLFW